MLALALAAPVGALSARESPKKKPPGQLWREFPLGRTLQQPSRTTTSSAATRARSTEKPKSSATPKRARSTEPRQAPAPAPNPRAPAPIDLPGKGQSITFADFALVIGYASGAILLVLGVVGVTARVRRLRQGRSAEAGTVAASPPEPEVREENDLGETFELEREDYFAGLGDTAEETAPLPAAAAASPPEPEVPETDLDETFELEREDYFAGLGDTAEETAPLPAAAASAPPEPEVSDVHEPEIEPAEGLEVGDAAEELEPIPLAGFPVEAELADDDGTPELAPEPESLLEEPTVIPAQAEASDGGELRDAEPADDSFDEIGDRVATILQAAVEAAEGIRQEAVEEAATIRSQAEVDAAARFRQLTAEIERVNSESQARAQALREEGERYVAERLLEADAEADKVMAQAEAQAQARRAAAEEAARIEDEARRRQAILREAALALEARLRGALEGIQHVSTDLEEALLEELPDAEAQRRDLAV